MTEKVDATAAADHHDEKFLARTAIRFTSWAERWYPDTYVFAALTLIIVVAALLLLGAEPKKIALSFGDGFWTLAAFTLQMTMVVMTGYIVAVSPPVAKLIDALAALPKNGRTAVAYVALMTMLASFLNYALSLVFGGLYVLALARRKDLKMDFKAAAAAAYLGLGATWALGINSSAAQLMANPASLPKAISEISGVIPFSETIFLPQSMIMAAIITIASVLIAYLSAPSSKKACTAEDLKVDIALPKSNADKITRPGEWLEHKPYINIFMVVLGVAWLIAEFQIKGVLATVSNLNTYCFIFIMLGLLMHWRLHGFLTAAAKSVGSTSGILIQFPIYAGVAALLTNVPCADGVTLSHKLAHFFTTIASKDSYAVIIGIYSAFLGLLMPSGGGKWVVEAPYVLQGAKDLGTHLGWSVQVYNAAEALPNLINPFWMLPLLGVLGLKARDIVGFTFTQLVFHVPLVLFLLWALAPAVH